MEVLDGCLLVPAHRYQWEGSGTTGLFRNAFFGRLDLAFRYCPIEIAAALPRVQRERATSPGPLQAGAFVFSLATKWQRNLLAGIDARIDSRPMKSSRPGAD